MRIPIRSTVALLALAIPMVGGLQACQKAAADEYRISVTDRGFEPAELRVPKGRPVTLVVTRKTDQTCATEMLFAGLDQRLDLPLNQPVKITLPAREGGTLHYACAMDMIKGSIVVR